MRREKVVVAGLGEVGKPLMELISPHHRTTGVDIDPPAEDAAWNRCAARLFSFPDTRFHRRIASLYGIV